MLLFGRGRSPVFVSTIEAKERDYADPKGISTNSRFFCTGNTDFEATISHDVTENDMKGVHVLVFTRSRQERVPRNLPESASYPDASF